MSVSGKQSDFIYVININLSNKPVADVIKLPGPGLRPGPGPGPRPGPGPGSRPGPGPVFNGS